MRQKLEELRVERGNAMRHQPQLERIEVEVIRRWRSAERLPKRENGNGLELLVEVK